jgi:hypothetical protein
VDQQGRHRALSQARIHRERHVGGEHELIDRLRQRHWQTLTAKFGRPRKTQPAALAQLLECIFEAGRRGDPAVIVARAPFKVADTVQRLQHLLAELGGLIENRRTNVSGRITETRKVVVSVDLENVVQQEVYVFHGGFIGRHDILSAGQKRHFLRKSAEKASAVCTGFRARRRRDWSGRDRSSVVFALAAVDRRDTRTAGADRQDLKRLFAPLRHRELIAKSHAKSEQLAGVG